MSQTYTPTGVYHASIELPKPGEAATAASVNTQALKFLADNTAFSKSVIDNQYVRRVPAVTSLGGGATVDANRTFYPASALGNQGVNSVVPLTLTADRTYSINDTSAQDGDWFFVANNSTTFNIIINTPAVNAVAVLGPGDWCQLERSGGLGWGVVAKHLTGDPIVTSSGITAHSANIVGTDGLVVASTTQLNGELIVNAPATLEQTLDVVGNSTFEGTVEMESTLSVAQQLTANQGMVVSGLSFFEGLVAFSGTGRQLEATVLGANADTNYSPTTVRFVWVPAATITAQRLYTVLDAGCVDGDHIAFGCLDDTDGIQVRLPGTTFMSLGPANTHQWAWARRIVGVWYFVAAGPIIPNV